MKRTVLFLSIFVASPAFAQEAGGGAANTVPANPAVSAAASQWESVSRYLQAAAEQMPEADYSYRPTPEVRSFGELIGHVAGAQQMFCAAALGEEPPAEDAVEKSAKSKAALVEALKKSSEYCARAYDQSDAQALAMVEMFGRNQPRLNVLVVNATHDNEHYGNIVTYMRMKGMVPPSSQPRR